MKRTNVITNAEAKKKRTTQDIFVICVLLDKSKLMTGR